MIDSLKEFNPGLKITFTVSPIRHWKDGAIGNNISKATLLLAIHKLQEKYPETGYFPDLSTKEVGVVTFPIDTDNIVFIDFEQSILVFNSAGEGSFHMAEELAFQ